MFVMEKGEDGKLHPQDNKQLRPNPEMVFITLKEEYATEEMARDVSMKWGELLMTNHLGVRPYPIEGHRLLFIINDGTAKIPELKEFVLSQEETEYLEYKEKKYYPGQDHASDGTVDINSPRIQAMLAKHGINTQKGPPNPKKKRKKTRRQKNEEKKKRKERKRMEEKSNKKKKARKSKKKPKNQRVDHEEL